MYDIYVIQTEGKELNMDIIWELLDAYKASEINCREKDFENEAIALSRQGRIFDKIIKIRTKAHEYYRAAFDLAQCLCPQNMAEVRI
jgi:hypothetical protein